MRRTFVLLGALALLAATAGCFSYDEAHNKRHWRMIRKDLAIMHEDADFALGLDAPSHASRSEY